MQVVATQFINTYEPTTCHGGVPAESESSRDWSRALIGTRIPLGTQPKFHPSPAPQVILSDPFGHYLNILI